MATKKAALAANSSTSNAAEAPSAFAVAYDALRAETTASLLLYRVGDFYEARAVDATIISLALDITLTERDGVAMCGVPAHALDAQVQQLLDAGHTVAIQHAAPVKGKGKGKLPPLEVREPVAQDTTPVAESLIDHIPLALLQRAPENVRTTAIDAKVEELADDIAAHGLLQSLIGYRIEPATDAAVFICGGGRRLQALLMLLEQNRVGAEYAVPVLLRPQVEAVEISLAENLQRHDMNPADEFAAFEALLRPGTVSPAALAKRFGYTERHVKQRLRLAALAPEILEALRERTITLDVAMAYASTSNAALQSLVFKAESRKPMAATANAVRYAIRSHGMRDDAPLFKFVGAEAYEAAGGGYEGDLFNAVEEQRTLDSAHLVNDLALAEVERLQADLLATLRETTPSLAGLLVLPKLEFYPWGTYDKPKVPDGFQMIDSYNDENAWKTIRNNSLASYAVVGINQEGEFAQLSRMFAVEKEQVEAVTGRRPELTPEETAAEEARIKAEQRQRGIDVWARRLAVGPFTGTPLEGKAFWPRFGGGQRVNDPERGYGMMIELQVFVTDAEIAAQADVAAEKFDQLQAEEAARLAAKNAAEAAAAQAHEEEIAQLLALDPAPAVVLIDAGPFYRHDEFDGAYLAHRPGGEEDENADGFETLSDLLNYAQEIAGHWSDIASFDVDHPGEPGAESEAQDEADLGHEPGEQGEGQDEAGQADAIPEAA